MMGESDISVCYARSSLCDHVFLYPRPCLGLQSHIKGSELVDVVK